MIKNIVCFLFLMFWYHSYSQVSSVKNGNQRIEKFLSEEGFHQNTVRAIVSDYYGHLWIATPNGLIKHDGYSFEYFYNDPQNPASIPNNTVLNLLTDSNGKIWIGTREGVCLYDVDKELFSPITNSFKDATFIKEDSLKRIWTAEGTKLRIYNLNENNEKSITVNLESKIAENKILDIEFLSDSEFLVATYNNIYRVEIKEINDFSFDINPLTCDVSCNDIRKIIKTDNALWIGTNNGIFQTLIENNKLINVQSFFNKDNVAVVVLTMFQDKDGELWIGTTGRGVLKYQPSSSDFISFKYNPKDKKGITSNHINCFYEDDFGVMWIGTGHGGLNKLDKQQKVFHNYVHNPYDENSLSSNLITDITEDKNGQIWFSFFGNIICRTQDRLDLDNGKRIQFNQLENLTKKLKNEQVFRLFQDKKGFWWIGTNKGVFLYNDKNELLRKVTLQIGEELIEPTLNRVIEQISSNEILLGGAKAYILKNPWNSIINNKPIKIKEPLFEIENNFRINEFVIDTYKNYWFATTNGIYQLVNDVGVWILRNHLTTKSENDKLNLSHNNIFSIHTSLNKDVWLGTFGGGLMKIQLNSVGEPESVFTFHKKDGLPDEAIIGILEDNLGMFWISTDNGITRFNPNNNEFDLFDINDGITSNNSRQSAYLKTRSGIMLMGGVEGLTIFNPEQIQENVILPKVLISELKINNEPVIAGKKINNNVILKSSISKTKEIILNQNNRNISLEVLVQHNSTPKKNRLAYYMEGVNNNWVEVNEGKTTANYTNLSSGTYKFLYKGANGDGNWAKETQELQIIVLAPWYLRLPSILIWILLLISVVFIIFKYLVRLEKLKQELNFEQLDKERVHEMDQAKMRFFTNVSHDFKTPLSLIMGPLEKISERNKGLKDQKYFSIIQNNILRLQRLIDQLVSYRKAEEGHLVLSYSKISLGDFMYPLMDAFENYSEGHGVNFYYKINSPNKEIVLDINKIERILLNLFSNAIKYGDSNREVSIEAGLSSHENQKSFYIEVANSGIGIPSEKIDKIFDRYYRGVNDGGNWSGTGIGLKICKSLVNLMNGAISVTSDIGKKTVFKINIPLKESLIIDKNPVKKDLNFVKDWLPKKINGNREQPVSTLLPNLLIIDDERDVRTFLLETFKSNYNVNLAVDGEDGLEKLNEIQPQLIICDVMMPKLNGYDFCKKIKSSSKYCHIPVILLTAIDDDENRLEGFEFGADDYITKPFSVKHLELRVKKLIENKLRIFNYFSQNTQIPTTNEPIKISERDKVFLEKLTSILEKNISSSLFGVEELAATIGMSNSSFFRRLKQLTGQSPIVYLRNFRLQKAAEILKTDGDLIATEVMQEIGIESTSYYSTSFKKLHGYSPSEYVKRLKS